MSENSKININLTIEIGIYSLILIVALIFRLGMLGAYGLSDSEAIPALQALDLSKGMNVDIGNQPGYVGLTTGLFTIMQGNDFLARLWSMIFGVGLVLVPALYRDCFGKTTVLIMSGLIAIDPAMVSLSRTVGSSMMAITCLLAGVGFFIRRKPILASLFGGLLLTSGTEVWPGLLVFALVLFAFNPSTNIAESEKPKQDFRKLILPGLGLALILSSQLLIHPNGISGIGTSMIDYFRSWNTKSAIDIGHFLVEVVWLQLPILVFGLISILSGLIKKDRTTIFFAVLWALALVVVIVNPSRSAQQLGWATIPLLMLTALLLNSIVINFKFDNQWIGFGQIVLTLIMIGLSFYYLVNITNAPESDPILFRNKIIGAFLPLILLAAITGLFTWGWNSSAAKTGLIAVLTILGVLMIFSNGWKSSGISNPIENELWYRGQTVTGDHFLKSIVADLGRWTRGQATAIDIEIAGIKSPALEWALRDINSVIQSNQVNKNATTPILITPVETALATGVSYRGEKIIWSSEPDFSSMKFWDWIKWLVFRRSPVQTTEILLWVRNDLFKVPAQ